jgi:hypothetical protein
MNAWLPLTIAGLSLLLCYLIRCLWRWICRADSGYVTFDGTDGPYFARTVPREVYDPNNLPGIPPPLDSLLGNPLLMDCHRPMPWDVDAANMACPYGIEEPLPPSDRTPPVHRPNTLVPEGETVIPFVDPAPPYVESRREDAAPGRDFIPPPGEE